MHFDNRPDMHVACFARLIAREEVERKFCPSGGVYQ